MMKLESLGIFLAIAGLVCGFAVLVSVGRKDGRAMRQEETNLVLTEEELEEELEGAEQGYALVHWSFDTEEEARSVYDALRLAAWRATTASRYAKVIEPTQPEGSDQWVTGITCEVVR